MGGGTWCSRQMRSPRPDCDPTSGASRLAHAAGGTWVPRPRTRAPGAWLCQAGRWPCGGRIAHTPRRRGSWQPAAAMAAKPHGCRKTNRNRTVLRQAAVAPHRRQLNCNSVRSPAGQGPQSGQSTCTRCTWPPRRTSRGAPARRTTSPVRGERRCRATSCCGPPCAATSAASSTSLLMLCAVRRNRKVCAPPGRKSVWTRASAAAHLACAPATRCAPDPREDTARRLHRPCPDLRRGRGRPVRPGSRRWPPSRRRQAPQQPHPERGMQLGLRGSLLPGDLARHCVRMTCPIPSAKATAQAPAMRKSVYATAPTEDPGGGKKVQSASPRPLRAPTGALPTSDARVFPPLPRTAGWRRQPSAAPRRQARPCAAPEAWSGWRVRLPRHGRHVRAPRQGEVLAASGKAHSACRRQAGMPASAPRVLPASAEGRGRQGRPNGHPATTA